MMMSQYDLDTWEELQEKFSSLEADASKASAASVSPVLFRGQTNSTWDLQTSLERAGCIDWSFHRYFRLAATAKPQVESFTGQRWPELDVPELTTWAEKYDSLRFTPFPQYEYFGYLRHHGFPSPLLDWSASPFVAAFFAFANAKADRVALFVYREHSDSGSKTGSSNDSQIHTLGPYVRTHSRHFLQQSRYSLAAKFDEGRWRFATHDSVFEKGRVDQDRLWKFTVPATERKKVLQHLDRFNLNAYSLLRDEEALLRTIAFRELEVRVSDTSPFDRSIDGKVKVIRPRTVAKARTKAGGRKARGRKPRKRLV